MHDEDADRDRHLLLRDQLVEDRRGVVLDAVLVDVHAGRLGGVVLLRHVDPVVADRAGEDLALVEGVLGDFAPSEYPKPGWQVQPDINRAQSKRR